VDKGYLIFAIDNPNYARLAYTCALTIKLTQPAGYNNVSVVTNMIDRFDDYKNVFDEIILYNSVPGMDARSRAYDYTPYYETVLIDSDMLFLRPMDNYWQIINDRELFITSAPQTYNNKQFKYGYYRQVFAENSWPDVYNAWTYFKQEPRAREFFDLVKEITDNPGPYIKMFMPNTLYTSVPTDEAFALALCMLDLIEYAVPGWDFPRITHMKPAVQQWREGVPDWTNVLRFSMTETGKVKLGVWQQSDLLHYVKKELITDDMIKMLEQAI
jgi:hypothetical protein